MPRYSNGRIYQGLVKFKGWKELATVLSYKHRNLNHFFGMVFIKVLHWHIAQFALSLKLICRVRFGRQSFGTTFFISTALFMIFYNHLPGFQSYMGYFESVALVIYGFFSSSFDIPWKEVIDKFWRPKSTFMTIHLGLFILSGTIQLIGINLSKKFRDDNNPLKWGHSIFGILLSKKSKLSTNYFNVYFDASFWILLAFIFLYYSDDTTYTIFLFIGGISLFISEYWDHSTQKLLDM